jgi:hypothetical protein
MNEHNDVTRINSYAVGNSNLQVSCETRHVGQYFYYDSSGSVGVQLRKGVGRVV